MQLIESSGGVDKKTICIQLSILIIIVSVTSSNKSQGNLTFFNIRNLAKATISKVSF